MNKCLLCSESGDYRSDLRGHDVYCPNHYSLLKEAEKQNEDFIQSAKKSLLEKKVNRITLTQKNLTRHETSQLIKNGVIEVKPCKKCGRKSVQVLHNDFLDPMDVDFYCKHHHNRWQFKTK